MVVIANAVQSRNVLQVSINQPPFPFPRLHKVCLPHASCLSIVENKHSHVCCDAQNTDLLNATDVLFTGDSAGGMGTIVNVDWFASQMPSAYVRGAPLAGWFFPGLASDQPSNPWAPPSYYANWIQGIAGGPGSNASVYDLYDGYAMPNCMAAQPAGDEFRCLSAHVFVPFIQTKIFVMENNFDTNQLHAQLGMPGQFNANTSGFVK